MPKKYQKPSWQVKLETDAKIMADFANLPYEMCYAMLSQGGDEYVVPVVKRIRTPEEKAKMDAADLSIEDVMNGRTYMRHQPLLAELFASWNAKLGSKQFGA